MFGDVCVLTSPKKCPWMERTPTETEIETEIQRLGEN